MLENDDDDNDVQFWSNAYRHLLPATKKKSNVFKLCRCASQRRSGAVVGARARAARRAARHASVHLTRHPPRGQRG